MLLRCLESGAYAPCGDGTRSEALGAAELAARLRGKHAQTRPELHLLLPAARCLLTSLPVARHEAKHLARTLPWTLEDRLLEPVEQTHVAHGTISGGTAPVAAINASWLQDRIAELHAAGLAPQTARSELLVLPWQRGQWSVFLPADDSAPALVRHDEHAGFACARHNLHTALQLLLNEQGEAPREVVVFAEHEALVSSQLFPTLLQSRLVPQQKNFAQLASDASLAGCNLLQGRFAPPLPWAQWWRQWRVAAALAVGLLLTDLALSTYEFARLERAASGQEAEVLELFRSVQPQGVVVDPRLQLEQALAAVGAAGHDGFLGLLSRMAPALKATPAARVQNLEYDASIGDMQLQILTADYAVAENLRAQLQQLGLQAELLGSSRDAEGNRTRLRVGGGA